MDDKLPIFIINAVNNLLIHKLFVVGFTQECWHSFQKN